MAREVHAPGLLDGRFDRMDAAQGAAQGWQLDFVQLDRGPLKAHVGVVDVAHVQLMRVRINRRTDQRGCAPLDRVTLAIPQAGTAPFLWCGQEVTNNSVLWFPPGSRISAIGQPDFSVYTIALPMAVLEDCGRFDPIPWVEGRDQDTMRVAPRADAAVARFRAHIDALFQTVQCGGAPSPRDLHQTLPREITAVLAAKRTGGRRAARHQRVQGLARAVEFSRAHAEDGPRVAELCEAAEMKERTLRLAFEVHVGMSPKEYVQALRLEAVRSALDTPLETGRLVSDVANRWGFWHLGQFAADYRARFGELPSQTVERARRRLGCRRFHARARGTVPLEHQGECASSASA